MADVICIETTAYYRIIDELVKYIDEKFQLSKQNRWIDDEAAMALLNISSKTTLAELRTTGKISFSQPMHKVILYDRQSIEIYIEKHVHETF